MKIKVHIIVNLPTLWGMGKSLLKGEVAECRLLCCLC